jgi:hypothetical protein
VLGQCELMWKKDRTVASELQPAGKKGEKGGLVSACQKARVEGGCHSPKF